MTSVPQAEPQSDRSAPPFRPRVQADGALRNPLGPRAETASVRRMLPSTRLFERSSGGLRLLARSAPEHRTRAWATILSLTLAISVADYLLGIELSLSILYLVPISLAAGWLGMREGFIAAIVSTVVRLGGDIVTVYPHAMPAFIWWNVGGAFAIFVFVTWLVSMLVDARHALEGRIAARTSELADSIAERRRLEIELLDVTARERAAIGRELHDELGQHLVATALAAKVLAQQLGAGTGGKEAQNIVQWIEEGIAKTRKLARGLLVARIEPDRLLGELEELAASANQGGVRCHAAQQGGSLHVTSAQCAQLFRIAQEAIGNALRHARPTEIEINLAIDEQATCLIVTDDGVGFQPNKAAPGMGLRIMQYRAQIIGASLTVLSAPGEGTRVICRLPVASSGS